MIINNPLLTGEGLLPINHPLRTGDGLLPINHPLHPGSWTVYMPQWIVYMPQWIVWPSARSPGGASRSLRA